MNGEILHQLTQKLNSKTNIKTCISEIKETSNKSFVRINITSASIMIKKSFMFLFIRVVLGLPGLHTSVESIRI